MRDLVIRQFCGLVVMLVLTIPSSAPCEERHPLTLDRAIELALERSLELRASGLEVELTEAEGIGARALTNPELAGGAGLRLGSKGQSVEASASLGQSFALGRPRRHRIAAATAGRDAADERLAFHRLRVAAEAQIAFVRAVAATQLVALAREGDELTRNMHDLAVERLRADAGTELEVNLAALEWSGARRTLIRALQTETMSRLELAGVLSIPPNQTPALAPELPSPAPVTSSEEELLRLALERRPDLGALELGQARTRATLAVARAEAWPDLTLEASYDFEEGSDHIVGLGLSIPLPMFQRNQGAVAREEARVALANVEIEAARLAVAREVGAAYRRYEAAQEIAELTSQETIGRAAGNLALLRASFEEGNVGFMEVLLVQREMLRARRDALEATVELFRTRVALELAVGDEVRR